VDRYPDRLNHFQPVLDRLEVKPSIGELSERTLLVEGKSDYALLRGLLEGKKIKFKVVPAHGATTLGPLVGLLRGWGWNFVVLLDSDEEGREAGERYRREFALDSEVIDLATATGGVKEIEGLLTEADRIKIGSIVGSAGKPTKKQIYNYFISNAGSVAKMQLEAAKGAALKGLVKAIEEALK
jgi:predicted ATP-dependent endonuclease of OLD family